MQKIVTLSDPSLFTDREQIRIRDAQTDYPGSLMSLDVKGGKTGAFEFLRRLDPRLHARQSWAQQERGLRCADDLRKSIPGRSCTRSIA